MKDIKVGIVGLGRLGSVHAQNLAFKIPGCKLVAACSLEQKELDWAKDYLKVEYTTTDYKKMVDEADIEAVVIVSSSPEHCWMIEYALDAGKHVFTDKPLGCSLEECKRAEAAVERHPDKLFFLGFMRRYDPSYADAKAQIDAGHIGKPYLVKATGLDPEALVESCIKFSKTSGGIFIDAASHDIDLMRWFLGGEVTEVYAAGTTFKHPEFAENGDTETGMAMLKSDNGTVAFLHVRRTAPHGTPRPRSSAPKRTFVLPVCPGRTASWYTTSTAHARRSSRTSRSALQRHICSRWSISSTASRRAASRS